MAPIPKKLRAEMGEDPYYSRCCVTGVGAGPGIKIEWHHNLIFAGRQVQEKWCILPLWEKVHARANDREVREKLDWIMLNRATDEELTRYSKAVDLFMKRRMLNKKYGEIKKE